MFRAHILNPGELRTLRKKFQEPLFDVVERLSDANYKIRSPDGEVKVVHYNNILKVHGEDRVIDPNLQEKFPPRSSMETVPTSEAPRRSTRERNRPQHLDDFEVEAVGTKLA